MIFEKEHLNFKKEVDSRKNTEFKLQTPKAELIRYSAELESLDYNQSHVITSIMSFTPAVIYIKDNQQRYLLVNRRFEELTGVRQGEAKGKTDFELLRHEVANQFSTNDNKVLTSKTSYQVKEQLVHPSGNTHTYLSTKFPVFDEVDKMQGVGSIAIDISELEKAKQQLRNLSANILSSQEKERAYISRELHDTLGQDMTLLDIEAKWLCIHLKDSDPSVAKRLAAISAVAEKVLPKICNLARGLRPLALDHNGLTEALEWFIKDFEARTSISCVFSAGTIPEIKQSVSIAAYRITQEALTNILRHSEASHVVISLQIDKDKLHLCVADNGCGIDQNDLNSQASLGILGMRERALLVGGSLVVRNRTGGGTKVFLTVENAVYELGGG